MKRVAAAAALGLNAFGVTDQAAAGNLFAGPFGIGDSWNVYEAIDTPMTWKEAWEFAPTRPDPTGGTAIGHLVTIHSLEENDFVQTNAPGNRWIGLTDRVGAAPGATESSVTADPLTMGWAWVTGEPFTFENWARDEFGTPIEPNNFGPGEDAVHLRGDGMWNDHQSGFAQDEPVPDPENTPEGPQLFPFVIEWSTNLPSEPPGFPSSRPDPPFPGVFPTPLARLPGPDGTASAWGAMDVRHESGVLNIKQSVDRVLSGVGTPVEGTLEMFAFRDPDTNAGTPIMGAAAVPFVSDTPGVDDNDFDTVVKGTVVVPEGHGGVYTFWVQSDDGFALRVVSQSSPGAPLVQHQFTSASGGVVDAHGTLAFPNPTGNSNTRGVINLAPGTYDIEYIMFENGGGAFGEVVTAKGAFVTPGTGGRWLLLGDGSSLPEEGPFSQPARLTEPAHVRNYELFTQFDIIEDVIFNFRSGATPTAESMVDDVVLHDNMPICCGRPGAGLPEEQRHLFPNGGGDLFSTVVTGQFEVFESGTLTFGLFSDDNSALRIVGQNFTAANSLINPGNVGVFNPEFEDDQWLVANFRTGNTDAYGLITLEAGIYEFEAFQVEEFGDAGLEIWVAEGDRLETGFDSARFFPLSTRMLPDQILPGNQGLGLVEGPGTGPPTILGDFNGDGVVDAADYTVWRDGLGTAFTPADFDIWKANFGAGSGAGAALSGGGVPEPATLWLGVLAVLCGLAATRARRRPPDA